MRKQYLIYPATEIKMDNVFWSLKVSLRFFSSAKLLVTLPYFFSIFWVTCHLYGHELYLVAEDVANIHATCTRPSVFSLVVLYLSSRFCLYDFRSLLFMKQPQTQNRQQNVSPPIELLVATCQSLFKKFAHAIQTCWP